MAIELQPNTAPAAIPRRMTLDEFLAWDNAALAEWVDGEISVLTVTDRHDALTGFLRALLQLWVEEQDLGVVKGEPYAMKLAARPSVREPDIFFVARPNLPNLRKTYLDGPADLIVEIVSEESRRRDTGEKRQEYAQNGVREYWIVDYAREQATFLRRNAAGEYEALPPDANGIFRSHVLPGLWLDVAWLWQTPLPKLRAVFRAWGLAE